MKEFELKLKRKSHTKILDGLCQPQNENGTESTREYVSE